jgi:hypothetical protein
MKNNKKIHMFIINPGKVAKFSAPKKNIHEVHKFLFPSINPGKMPQVFAKYS